MIEQWKCKDCGSVFDEPDSRSWKEEMSGDGWAWQTFTDYFCPVCGSEDIKWHYWEDEDDDGTDSL